MCREAVALPFAVSSVMANGNVVKHVASIKSGGMLTSLIRTGVKKTEKKLDSADITAYVDLPLKMSEKTFL